MTSKRRIPAAQMRPGSAKNRVLKQRGRRECRVQAAPMARLHHRDTSRDTGHDHGTQPTRKTADVDAGIALPSGLRTCPRDRRGNLSRRRERHLRSKLTYSMPWPSTVRKTRCCEITGRTIQRREGLTMARKVRHSALERRSARLKLQVQRRPYSGPSLARGISLMYRRNNTNGTWDLAREVHRLFMLRRDLPCPRRATRS